MPKKKITIYLSEEEHKTITDFSKKIDSTFSAAGVIAIKLGIASINLSINPKMKKFFESQEKDIKNDIENEIKL